MKKFSPCFRDHIFKWCTVGAMALVLTGCSWFHKKPKASSPGTTSVPQTQQGALPATTALTNQSQLLLATTTVGRVESVNAAAKFVVLKFPIGQVPPIDTRMVIYHGDAKTGEVKITGPTQDDLTVADIVLGTVEMNDEVRTN